MKEPDLLNQAISILENSAKNRALEIKMTGRLEREVAHGYNAQKWVTILNPKASNELLVAALLHDIERAINLKKDTGFKGDRSTPTYADYKKEHALRSALYVIDQLILLDLSPDQIVEIASLISHHDDLSSEIEKIDDPDLNILVAADSFSFFTSIASNMLEREGETRLADKIYFMIEKMPLSLRKLLQEQDFTDSKHGLDPHKAFIIEEIKTDVLSKIS